MGVPLPQLPPPEVYAQEYEVWPWGRLLQAAATYIVHHAREGGLVIDVMCGPGVLLSKVHIQRPDLHLIGYDESHAYIEFGRAKFPGITLERANVLELHLEQRADLIVCTGGLHHLPFQKQRSLLQNLRSCVESSGALLLGEEVLSPFESGVERRTAAVELGTSLLTSLIKRGAAEEHLRAALAVLVGDLFMEGEYKLHLDALRALVEEFFVVGEHQHIWPGQPARFGDFLLLCRPRL